MGYLRITALALAFALVPVAASADPVTQFFLAIGFSASVAAIATNIVISIGLSIVDRFLAPKPKSGASVADAKVNVRSDTAIRWQAAGSVSIGGSIGTFCEFDGSGNLWYIVAHADAELTNTPTYYLDGIPVAVSAGGGGFTAGDVLTNDFCLEYVTGAQYAGSGVQFPVYRLYTITPSSSAAYGALPADFTTAFAGSLPANFRLAGVCYTLVRCAALSRANYQTIMHWRGALGLGEPSVVMVGNFNRMYDPRNGAHDINDSTTWTASNGNPAIIWAWWRTSKYGRNRAMTEINWTNVAAAANTCDLTVLDRSSVSTPLYRCGVAFPDNKLRQECEAEILATADAFVAYDSAGLAYPVVGYYAAPTLSFTAARDILSAQTQIIDDGETAVDGVVVTYIEPSLGYTSQPCAPWQNLAWYDGVSVPNYLQVEILGCQNHNQAVRLGKAIGQRVAAQQRAALGVTVKGLLAKTERIIDLTYDTTFTGNYEIVTPVEETGGGSAFSFTVVPVGVDRWYLNAGEEGPPPVATPAIGITVPTTAPGALVVAGSTSPSAGTISTTFTTANDASQYAVYVYRGATNVFSAASLVTIIYTRANFGGYASETGVGAGTWYVWAVPQGPAPGSIAGAASGPFTVIVT